MDNGPCYIDATTFMGMHDEDTLIRQRSTAFFQSAFRTTVTMNLEQVGLCDALVWRHPRAVQDAYYPFMDRLHTDMHILRSGYEYAEIRLGLEMKELHHLRPWKTLLAAQVLHYQGTLFTHDPELRELACLQTHLGRFDPLMERSTTFPEPLNGLYLQSQTLIITHKDWHHVSAGHLHSLDHTA